MPAIPSVGTLIGSSLVQRSTLPLASNTTDPILEVICAWPVSGQYGPGTRYLYYVLMAACVLARKEEWIRNACLAAVLLFPAVAALHGIVLAALHVPGAVDMDVYGAFQLCAIGILTAPATVKLSNTYFNNPGRNIIFLWTGLQLAGLLSLTVEFIRITPTPCPFDDPATSVWADTQVFHYNSTCGMICNEDTGPKSPLRGGSADNIYVIPSPHQLDFNTATLLAAACCIPAILSMLSMWIKILDGNWEKLIGKKKKKDDEPIAGTNGATPIQMTGIAEKIRDWLTLIEIPVFVAAVLAIIVKGEMNFWSEPVNYQTEPIASIGQWAPIVGTGLAVVGSLYLMFAADMEAEEKQTGPTRETTTPICADCGGNAIRDSTDSTTPPGTSGDTVEAPSPEIERTATFSTIRQAMTSQSGPDPGGRRKVARFFNVVSTYLAAKAHNNFEDTGFEVQERTNFPEIPAEMFRNERLYEIRNAYNNTPLPRSRATSFVESETSNGEGSSRIPTGQSSVPARPPLAVTRRHSNTMPAGEAPFERPTFLQIRSLYSNLSPGQWSPQDGPTPDEHQNVGHDSISDADPAPISPSGPTTPKIVVSSN
ncbi:uncharacterized protein N7484_009630 [Penicillium longicatenatum]|uniref:uncharacterized protein n=1 Tax=Penicillium longicatenatum TaxID=1561947 RepID=UPI0025469D06|nr:uncharacterized protein N7484_009630 [Penicillium longicatenatum]KAJ5636317.1 hypothetical protein N7484_009630 [Penicillium longicatenatum]